MHTSARRLQERVLQRKTSRWWIHGDQTSHWQPIFSRRWLLAPQENFIWITSIPPSLVQHDKSYSSLSSKFRFIFLIKPYIYFSSRATTFTFRSDKVSFLTKHIAQNIIDLNYHSNLRILYIEFRWYLLRLNLNMLTQNSDNVGTQFKPRAISWYIYIFIFFIFF